MGKRQAEEGVKDLRSTIRAGAAGRRSQRGRRAAVGQR